MLDYVEFNSAFLQTSTGNPHSSLRSDYNTNLLPPFHDNPSDMHDPVSLLFSRLNALFSWYVPHRTSFECSHYLGLQGVCTCSNLKNTEGLGRVLFSPGALETQAWPVTDRVERSLFPEEKKIQMLTSSWERDYEPVVCHLCIAIHDTFYRLFNLMGTVSMSLGSALSGCKFM